MKAKLTIANRFAILSILPATGYATLKVVRKLREQLSLTEKEMKKHNVAQIREAHVVAIKSAETDAEALTITTEIFGAGDAQRLANEIRDGTLKSNQITWTNEDETTEMEFGEFAEKMIADSLKELDDANPSKLEDRHFRLYEIFVEGVKQ